MSKVLVLMGAPGAGKGTQARLIQERLRLPQISTGDIFRALAETDSPLAREVKELQDAGRLIPDEVVIRVVRERTNQPDCQAGYVLDGFPRTPAQAETLEGLVVEQGKKIDAILVDVPFELLERRASGRRQCPVCHEIYNIYFLPPRVDEQCDFHPGVKLEQRADDLPEKIRVRLRTYEEQTRPLLGYYEKTGRLHRVDGTREPEVIYKQIEEIIKANQN